MGEIGETIDRTAWIDTHEHLLEPATRARGAGAHPLQPCTDFALLFAHYASDDLVSAGMPASTMADFFAPTLDPAAKWKIIQPWWQHIRSTGYGRAVGETVRVLYGVEEWNAEACVQVSAEIAAGATHTDHFSAVLRRSGILTCQVNSLEASPYCETTQPDLLLQDLSLLPFSTELDIPGMRQTSGMPVHDLADWHQVIDWAFSTYGPRAVAVKSQAAYTRDLNYTYVPAERAAPLFARVVQGDQLDAVERHMLEDHLMHYCMRKAVAANLPIKLHCGYLAGTGALPLRRLSRNASDLTSLLDVYGDGRFVLMHMGYPHQHEYIALAKHYRNVYLDLCWSWIVSPEASVRFLREYLLAAPANKILCFGGDYTTVENVAGHASVARHGLTLTLEGLVADGWLTLSQALQLVRPLMQDNARDLFGLDEAGRLLKKVD